MILQAPGTILQMLYVRERIRKLKLSNYLEIGCGKGHFSKLFLEEGMRGIALDMNPESVSICNTLNSKFIVQKKFNTIYGDFLDYHSNERFELIFSCMVIEHLQDDDFILLDIFTKPMIFR